jgi:hypothetical protein
MTGIERQEVKRRRVFYIPGYDPIHPRRYRELYRSEGAEQARISGYTIKLTGRQGGDAYGWHVAAWIGGTETETDFDVLIWSDIVRASMERSIPATYLMLIRTAWTYIASGALARLMRLRKGPVIAALYPIGMLILQLVLALLAGWIGGRLVVWGLGASLSLAGSSVWADFALRAGFWAVFIVTVVLVLRLFRQIDNRFFAYYLMHDYSYSARSRGADPPELRARMAEFETAISAALASDVDEVLVVGHSSGAHIGVSVLAELVRAGSVRGAGPALGLLTLGQVVPMVSFLPDARKLRRDLHDLSQAAEITWIDVTAPGDGCAFALCDPVAVSGVAPGEGKRWPLVFSAAFTQSLSPQRWKDLKWRFFRLHFQYLCAFDRPKDYDYFQITAGPNTLASRYAGRPPSKSRIDAPVSKYTSMAP